MLSELESPVPVDAYRLAQQKLLMSWKIAEPKEVEVKAEDAPPTRTSGPEATTAPGPSWTPH